MRANHVIATLIAMMMAMATPFAVALDDDREQPLRVVADSAEHNEVSGVTVYTGNVVITQGSMRIEADVVTLKGIDSRINNMVANGNPARLQQQPKPEDAMMYARAQRIIYYVDDDRVRLIDKASIEQEESIVNSDEIEYLVKDRIVKAHGGIEGKTGNGVKPKRVEFIYTPQKNADAPSKEGASPKNTPPPKSTTPQKKDTP